MGWNSLPRYRRASPWIGGAFGFFAAIYTTFTGETLNWRSGTEDPLSPLEVLFDVHPLLGIVVFTAVGFGLGWVERHLQRGYASD